LPDKKGMPRREQEEMEMTTGKWALDFIKGQYKPTEHICLIIWCVEDVIHRAEERGLQVTKQQTEEIIDEMEHRHDATIGVSWDTIDTYLNDIEREQMEKEEEKRRKEQVVFT
jgi:hypothetical protein